MSLSAMDCMISVLPEDIHEGTSHESPRRSADPGDAVAVPFRHSHRRACLICMHVLLQCPVGDPVPGIVGPRDKAASGRRADTAGIGLSEHHPLTGQPFHIGGLEHPVVIGHFLPERQGGILPSHIIHHKEDDIRPALLSEGVCAQRGQRERGRTSDFFITRG